MAKPYLGEMRQLPATFAQTSELEIGRLCAAVRRASAFPLVSIGSGGSITAATMMCDFHRTYTGQVAIVATPFEMAANPPKRAASVWLFSSGGRNVDINRVAEVITLVEPAQLVVICGSAENPLATFCSKHDFIDFFSFASPAGKDGFLATNSLLSFASVLAKAYCTEFDSLDSWSASQREVQSYLTDARNYDQLRIDSDPLWERDTLSVLFGNESKAAALDVESKFTEAALGSVQVADFRNFAHGRHHWLAKRGSESAILCFVSPNENLIAQRTLDLLPEGIPKLRIDLPGAFPASTLIALITAFWMAGFAGLAKDLDPGQPGVPDFGRKLYNLSLGGHRKQSTLSFNDRSAIRRKADADIEDLRRSNQLEFWIDALGDVRKTFRTAEFDAVVLDYDGTLVTARDRFEPLNAKIAAALHKLLQEGLKIGIATGRGASVSRDLRRVIKKKFWDAVTIGYYNGAEIGSLSDDSVPAAADTVSPALQEIVVALSAQKELAASSTRTDRKFQLTLEAKSFAQTDRLWHLAREVVQSVTNNSVKLTRSSHSIDIIPAQVSKTSVINIITKEIPNSTILAIGDKGRWPGNDFELLSGPFSLSVDECNVDPLTCWNLGSAGQRGVSITLEYLEALICACGRAHFREDAFK